MTESELSFQEQLPEKPVERKKAPPTQPKQKPAAKSGGSSRSASQGSTSSISSQPETGHVTAMHAQLKAEAQKRKLSRSPGTEPGTTLSLTKRQHAASSNEFQKPRQTARPEPTYGLHTEPLLNDNRFKELSREENSKGLIHKDV